LLLLLLLLLLLVMMLRGACDVCETGQGDVGENLRLVNGEGKSPLEEENSRVTPLRWAEQKQREDDERSYIDNRAHQQQQIVNEQDAVLEDMGTIMNRLKAMGDTMDTELDTQNAALGDFNDEITETQGTMDQVIGKIEKLLATSDHGKLCCMFILFVIVVILFFILIYG